MDSLLPGRSQPGLRTQPASGAVPDNQVRCGFLRAHGTTGKVQANALVPEGRQILVPILYTVAQTSDNMPCDQMQVGIRKFVENASGLRFSLDGKVWENLERSIIWD